MGVDFPGQGIETNWDGFSDKLFNGSVRLKVDSSITTTAALHAADLQAAIQAVLGNRFMGRMNDKPAGTPNSSNDTGFGYTGFGQLGSGKAMTNIFNKLDADLASALLAQTKILDELGWAFTFAGKNYEGADEDSRNSFNSLSKSHDYSSSLGKWKAVEQFQGFENKDLKVPKFNSWKDDKSSAFDSSHKGAAPADANFKSAYALTLESPDSIDIEMMKKLGDWFTMDSVALVDAGAIWKSYASFLQQKFADFDVDIAKIRDNGQWTGPGIDSIANALNSYMTQVNSLVQSIWEVGELLVYSGGWISTTSSDAWSAMFEHSKDDLKAVEEFRPKYKAVYFYGWQQTFDAIPSIPSPTSIVSPFTPAAPKVDAPKVDQPGYTPGGNNLNGGGSPSTPGSPTIPTDGNPAKPTDDNPANPTNPTTPKTDNPSSTTDTKLSTITSALTTLAQDGTQLVESLASQASTLVQSLVSSQTTQKTADTTAQDLEKQLASLVTPTTPVTTDSPGGSPGSPGGTPKGGPSVTPTKDSPQTRLFPRATVATTEDEKDGTVTTSRAGVATGTVAGTGTSTGTGMGGSPMGGAAGAGQGANKEYKRAEYLKSGQNLEGVFESIPEAVRPVAEEK